MKRLELNNLYDCYSILLTDKERVYFQDYYFDDLSLSEIALNNKVSRSAVGKMLKLVEEKLISYESKLHLMDIKSKLSKCLKIEEIEQIKEIIRKIGVYNE